MSGRKFKKNPKRSLKELTFYMRNKYAKWNTIILIIVESWSTRIIELYGIESQELSPNTR